MNYSTKKEAGQRKFLRFIEFSYDDYFFHIHSRLNQKHTPINHVASANELKKVLSHGKDLLSKLSK